MATAKVKTTTPTPVIESVTLTLSEDEAEMVFALIGQTNSAGEGDPTPIYIALRDALGYKDVNVNYSDKSIEKMRYTVQKHYGTNDSPVLSLHERV